MKKLKQTSIKNYEAPKLISIGNISIITLNAGSANLDGGNQQLT